MLGPAVPREVEDRRLVGPAEVEVAAGDRELVAQRQRLRHDLARRRDDRRVPIIAASSPPHLATPTTQVPF